MKRIFSSKLFAYLSTMVGAAVLVVGAAAYISSRPDPGSETATNTETYGRNYALPDTEPKFTAADLPKGVQTIAGEFILAAAGREDLAKAWKLTHPELRAQCNCTYKEWLTGNIPVQYYPSKDIKTAAFDVEDITPREIFLRVLVLPKDTSKVKPQVFDIGLKAVGNGAKKTWLVSYWNAKVTIPVPATPE